MSKDYSQNSLLALAVSSKSVIMFDVIMACLEQDLSSDEVSRVTVFNGPLLVLRSFGGNATMSTIIRPFKIV